MVSIGFNTPLELTTEMLLFIGAGNFGLLDPSKPKSDTNPLLISQLKSIRKGLTSSSLLTPLFAIYAMVNGLRSPNTRLLCADENMKVCFSNLVSVHNQDSSQKSLDLSSFAYAQFQTIVRLNGCNRLEISSGDSEILVNDKAIVASALEMHQTGLY